MINRTNLIVGSVVGSLTILSLLVSGVWYLMESHAEKRATKIKIDYVFNKQLEHVNYIKESEAARIKFGQIIIKNFEQDSITAVRVEWIVEQLKESENRRQKFYYLNPQIKNPDFTELSSR